ncbi:transposase [Streptosporangium sp. NPDC000396]|uniref:transposase n=1 Tax=Streptosporangium sp. NPDC000396 TaxID=3366185 RepID=UPI0036C011F6
MAETRRTFEQDFRDGAVRIVEETDKSVAQVARELGINAGTLANWVNMSRKRRATTTSPNYVLTLSGMEHGARCRCGLGNGLHRR